MPLSIDHIVIAVSDLDQAVRDYEALGFTVLPGGEDPRGSRNALVVLADGAYLEIIAFSRPVPDFRWWRVLDAAGSGLADYALLPDSLDVDLARARAGGVVMDGPIDGARLQPDGTRLAWRSARPPESDIPFLCEDVTARALRVPEGAARKHANGVTGVAGVTVAVRDLGCRQRATVPCSAWRLSPAAACRGSASGSCSSSSVVRSFHWSMGGRRPAKG